VDSESIGIVLVVLPILLIIAVIVGVIKDRPARSSLDELESRKRDVAGQEAKLRMWEEELKQREQQLVLRSGSNTGIDLHGAGYIINLPDEQRANFIDILNGFKTFVRLQREYQIAFSFSDSTDPNRFEFRFTVVDDNNGATAQAGKDISDYLTKVTSGKPMLIDPTPRAISQYALSPSSVKTLTAKIDAVQKEHTELVREHKDLNKAILELTTAIAQSVKQPFPQVTNTIMVQPQSGDRTVTNSPFAIAGDQSEIRDIENVHINQTPERTDDLPGKIDELILLLKQAQANESTEGEDAIRHLKNVRDEMTEGKPDKGLIRKWFDKAKDALALLKPVGEAAVATKEVVESIAKLLG
jgi:uncharacterized phage infection (PIP) family protein YhgE